MITSSAQCEKIQSRRVKSGKRGYAKAVRRYFLNRQRAHLHPTFYQDCIHVLPVNWNKPV